MLWELDVNMMLNKGQMPWEAQISKVLSLKVSLKCCEQESGTVGGGGGGLVLSMKQNIKHSDCPKSWKFWQLKRNVEWSVLTRGQGHCV